MIDFKKAELKDAKKITEVKVKSFIKEVELYGFGPEGYDSVENLERIINDDKTFCYKILDDDKIIGGFTLVDKGDSHFRVGGIYVDLDYQNQGIGSKAFEFIEKEFNNIKKWSLDTPYLSYRNHYFYEKIGYVKVGETKPNENGFYLVEYEKIKNN